MTNFRLVQANCYARRYDGAVHAGRIAIELTPVNRLTEQLKFPIQFVLKNGPGVDPATA